jgi:hypothetical protein
MKWTIITNGFSPIRVYNLVEGDKVNEVLRYNETQRSLRIVCDGQQRLFFAEEVNFHKNRLVYVNEYGFKVGGIHFEQHDGNLGLLEIEGQRFHYQLDTDGQTALSLFKENALEPLLNCRLATNQAGKPFNVQESKANMFEFASLLFGLCWWVNAANTPDRVSKHRDHLSLA